MTCKPYLFRWLLSAILTTGSLSLAPAQTTPALPEGVTRVTSVEGITEYQLKNGLRVLMFPDASKPTITVNITYMVGSRHEGYGESGMAHLLEHMVFKGSPKHKNIPQELTEHGCWPNGTTWYDRTNYFETFSATDENLRWALDLEADRMVNSFIDKKDLDTEFSVVRNEFEMGENSPQYVLMERVLAGAYLWHNYGKSTIGSRQDIERVPIDNLKAFYRKYYQPDNAILLVAGKFDEAKTLAMVAELYGPIPKPDRELPKTYTVEPVQDGERAVSLRRVGDTQGVAVAYHTPAGSHPDYAPMDVLMDVLTNEPSGRIYKALVENKKAAYQYGWTPALYDPGFAYFYAELRKEQSLDSARSVMLGTLDEMAKKPATAEEVERAKTKLLSRIDMMFKQVDRVGLNLSEYMAAGDWRLIFLYRDAIRKVTPADVQRVAQAYLKPSNRTVGTFIPDQKPDRAEIPAAPDVAALVKDYKGEAQVAAGEAFDPSPANIDARTRREMEGKTIRYTLLPKQTRGNSVVARLSLQFGNEQNLMGKAKVADFTAMMLDRGTKTRTMQQIRDELEKLKARAYAYSGGQSLRVGIETEKDKLPAVLAIVTDYLRNPIFAEAELEKLRQEQLAFVESNRQEPQAIAFREYERIMNAKPKGHFFETLTFDEEVAAIKAVTIADVRQFYKDYYGADNAFISIVGAYDEPTVKQLLKKELTGWKAAKPFARIEKKFEEIKPQNKSIQTDDKANSMLAAGMKLPLRDDDPDFPALAVANHILGEGFLNSRLASRIRQKEGISYGVGSWVNADELDKVGSFGAYAIYNPENSEKLVKAMTEELAKLIKDGITADELKAAKTSIIQNGTVMRSQDGMLANRLNDYRYWNRTFAWDADYEKKVDAVTVEQVNAAFKKHIDPAKLTIVQAGDFAKAAKTVADKAAATPPASQGSGKKD